MRTMCQSVFRFIVVLSLINTAIAQENREANAQIRPPAITAFGTNERVRFTAPSSVVQIRLEVYNSAGRKLLDNEVRGGNVLDWHMLDGQAEPLPEGIYLCVVTIKSFSGRINQRIGSVTVEGNAARVQAAAAPQMTPQQAEAIGPVEENSLLTVMREDEALTPTVIAHNGEDGQITRGRGALSFRIGDFFSGKDQEQMRLTAEGNLGIGISHPQARLDVDGVIRASRGIIFPDGTTQYSASSKTLGARSSRAGELPDGTQDIQPQSISISGSGTTGRMTKWIDGPNGVVGDSVVTDTGHLTIDSSSNQQAVGTGTLIIQGNVNKERVELRSAGALPGPALQGKGYGGTIASPTATLANTDLFIIGGSGHNGSGLVSFNAGTIKIKAQQNWTPSAQGAYINFETTPSGSPTSARTERMRITGSGNVGIGTANPARPLEIANGKMRFSSNLGDIEFTEVADLIAHATEANPVPTDPAFRVDTGTNLTRVFTVLNNGRVGIGTPSPISLLHVEGSSGVGIYGSSSSVGVTGSSNTGVGVRGNSSSGAGVFGSGGVNGYGVYGSNCCGYAGYFLGAVHVNGSLSKASGSFKIDHPLDPENKYLYHSFVESPDMMNIYNGIVGLDGLGEAVVTLPEWFGALNYDFRYQLTAIGAPGPNLHIAEEVKNNRFRISGGQPGVKVSWQLTGIRQDAYANAHRIKVEENKPENERGHYLHPRVFNQPEEKSVEWARNPEMMRQIKREK